MKLSVIQINVRKALMNDEKAVEISLISLQAFVMFDDIFL